MTTHYTDKDRARAALHEDRTNGWITQEHYETELRRLNETDARSIGLTVAILLVLILLYVTARGLGWI